MISLPDIQMRALDRWCKDRGLSRAEAVRRAVHALLPPESAPIDEIARHPAVGRFKPPGGSVAYARRLRRMWERG